MRTYANGWHSRRTGKYMEFIHIGHAGAPVIVFPTSSGDHREFQFQGMIEPLAGKIERGDIQIFCTDTTNWEGLYNSHIHPRERVERYVAMEEYLIHELIPHIRAITGTDYLVLTGISLGGYHTINFALKHPELVNRAVSFSGSFSIKGVLDGYYDDLCYMNNPTDYIQNLNDPWYIDMYNTHTELIFVAGDLDVCLDRSLEMTSHLSRKGIRHRFFKWEGGYKHDWEYWKQMIHHYI